MASLAGQEVSVRCYTAAGLDADSMFTLSFTDRTVPSRISIGENTGGYVWANSPTAADYDVSRLRRRSGRRQVSRGSGGVLRVVEGRPSRRSFAALTDR